MVRVLAFIRNASLMKAFLEIFAGVLGITVVGGFFSYGGENSKELMME